MRRVAAVAALVLLAGAPACAHPSPFGAPSAYPAYGPVPYAAVPRHWSGGGRHHHGHHAAPQHHGGGHHHHAPRHGHHGSRHHHHGR